jgi:integrase
MGDTNHTNRPAQAVFNKVGQNLYRLESSGTYYALFKRSGKQIRRSLKTTDGALAKRRLNAMGDKVARLNGAKGAGKITFTELADRWLSNLRVNLKESSSTRLAVCVKGLEPFLGKVTIRNISNRHCEEWLTKRGKSISAQSYKHERRVLIAILDYACRDGLLLENPAREALPIRKIPKPKIIIPTQQQFRLLVQTIRQADIRAQSGADLVELLGYSGMRLNEATSLTWGDVDWDRGSFTVTGGEKGTKNQEARVVPLFPALRELFNRIKGDRKPVSSECVIPIKSAQTAIINSCTNAGLPHFLHHSMRHYFCSNAIEAGIDFKVIAGWLGHKDGGYLVAKTYGHLRDVHSFEMAKRMTFSASEKAPENVLLIDESSKS